MSVLKFRAWHKEKKQMRHLDFINFSKADFCGVWTVEPPRDLFGIATTKGDLWQNEDVIIMQSFFGLRDINGYELFESDIVKLDNHNIIEIPVLDFKFISEINIFYFKDCTLLGNKFEHSNIFHQHRTFNEVA